MWRASSSSNRRCSPWRAGPGGIALGAAAVAVASAAGHQPVVLPAVAVVGGLVTAAVVGTLAGAYPALRAAWLTPTEALRSA